MFNVLPDIFKADIRKNYTLRVCIVAGILIIFLQISLLIFLFPTIIESVYAEKDLKNDIIALRNMQLVTRSEDATDVIPQTNTMLRILNTTLQYPHVVPYVDGILAQKNQGVRLSNIGYVLTDEKHATIAIQGYASTRDAFVSFLKALQDSETFAQVDSPVSNLAKEKNIEFTITVSIENTHE